MTHRGKVTTANAVLAFLCAVVVALLVSPLSLLPAATAFAEDSETTVPAESGTTTDGNDASVYSITIPSNLEMIAGDSGLASGSMEITGKVDAHYLLSVTAAGSGALANSEGDKLDYALRGATFSVDAGSRAANVEQQVTATTIAVPAYPGTYTDTVAFTAKCELATHALAFDANGGELSEGASSKSLAYGDSYGELPTPTRAGYTFLGWFTSIDSSEQVDSSTTMGDDPVTVYAHWRVNTYTIAYDPNSASLGQGSMDSQEHTYGESAQLKANEFTNSYSDQDKVRFAGWNTEPDGSGTFYANKQDISDLAAEDGATVTLYAQWEFEYVLAIKYDDSVDDNVTDYKSPESLTNGFLILKTAIADANYFVNEKARIEKWLIPGKPVLSLDDLLEGKTQEAKNNWNKAWKLTSVETSEAAAKELDVHVDRQQYRLDLNGRLEGATSGTGNIKGWGTANVYVNGSIASDGDGCTDYFRWHKYGAEYRMESNTVNDGFEFLGVAGGSNPMEGRVDGAAHNKTDTSEYDVTSVTFFYRKTTSSSESTSDEGADSSNGDALEDNSTMSSSDSLIDAYGPVGVHGMWLRGVPRGVLRFYQ